MSSVANVGIKLTLDGAQQAEAGLRRVQGGMAALGNTAESVRGALQQLAGAFAGVVSVRAFMQAADAVTQLHNQLRLATGSTQAAAQAYQQLFEIAQRSRVSFTELGGTFASIARASESLGLSQQQLLRLTEAIGNAIAVSGQSAQASQAALVQLSQALASGVLRGEELNSVLEQAPRLARALADGLGVPIGALRKLGEEGELTAERVIGALQSQASVLANEVAGSVVTVGQAFTQLQNSATVLVGEIDRVSGSSATLASVVQAASESLDNIARAFRDTQSAGQQVTVFADALAVVFEVVAVLGVNVAYSLKQIGTELGGLAAQAAAVARLDFRAASEIGRMMREDAEAIRHEAVALSERILDSRRLAEQARQSMQQVADTHAEDARRAAEQANLAAAAAAARANEELRKLMQTEEERLAERRDKFLADGADRVAVERWYAAEVAKIHEQATKREQAEQRKRLEAQQKAREAMRDNEAKTIAALDRWMEHYEQQQIDAVAAGVEERKKLREAEARAAAEAAERIAAEQEAAAQKVLDRIQDATADVFYDLFSNIEDGWSNLWNSMKAWALRTLAELAARAATVQIVVPIMTSMTGTSTTAQAVQALTGGQGGFSPSSLSSLVSPGSLLSKVPGMEYVTSLLATQLPGTTMLSGGALALAGGGTAGGPVASLAAAENLAGMTGGLSIGAALGMGALGGLGYSLLGGSLGLPQGQYSGITSSLGGALGAWGGTALGGTSLGAAMGATVGSALPVIGTAAGAILGGLASSLFGGDEQSPSVIFNAQRIRWGDIDAERIGGGNFRAGFEFHTKDGADYDVGEKIAAALEQVAAQQFAEVETAVGAFGDKYVDMLRETTIEFGRKVAGAGGGAWDFGSDMELDELLAKYSDGLRKAILEAAEDAFEAAGTDLVSSSTYAEALALVAGRAEEAIKGLQETISAGVQSGDVEAYAAALQQLSATIKTITATWEQISRAADDLVQPPTAYEAAVRQANAQFDDWVSTLQKLGFAQERIEEIEAKRAATLARLNAEMGPLAEAEAARASALEDAKSAAKAALNALAESVRAEQDRLQAQFERESDILNDRIGAIRGVIATLDNAIRSVRGSVETTSIASQTAARLTLQSVLTAVRGGADITGFESVIEQASATLTRNDPNLYQTREQFVKAQAQSAWLLEELNEVGGEQLTTAELQLQALKDGFDAEMARLDDLVAQAEKQINALLGIKDGTLSVEAAVQEVEKAIGTLAAAINGMASAAASRQTAAPVESLSSPSAAAAAGYITSPVNEYGSYTGIGDSGYRLQVTSSGATLYFPGGGSHTVSGPTAAQLLADTYGLKPGGLNGTLIRTRAQGGYTPPGLTLVGEEGPELVNFRNPAMVYSNDKTSEILGNREVVAELKALRSEVIELRAQARRTADAVNGNPEAPMLVEAVA